MTNTFNKRLEPSSGLYEPCNEHDACGLGFIANIKGVKSHKIIEDGIQILENLEHRGATGADPLMGDGAGINPTSLYDRGMCSTRLRITYGFGL